MILTMLSRSQFDKEFEASKKRFNIMSTIVGLFIGSVFLLIFGQAIATGVAGKYCGACNNWNPPWVGTHEWKGMQLCDRHYYKAQSLKDATTGADLTRDDR